MRAFRRVLFVFLSGVLLVLCWNPTSAAGQSNRAAELSENEPTGGDSVEVVFKESGAFLTGVLQEQDEESVQLKVEGKGAISIKRDRVKVVQPLGTRAARHRLAQWRRPDANRARLLFAPTARTYEPGQLYAAGHQLFLPYAGIGVGNVLDVRAGASYIPFTAQLAYAGAKVGLMQNSSTKLAVGGFGMMTTNVYSVETGEDEYGIAAYGLATFDRGVEAPSNKALTLGGGYVASGGIFDNRAFGLVGGEYRFRPHLKVLSENYVLVGDGVSVIGSVGLRYFSGRAALGGGLYVSDLFIDAGLPVLPMVTVSYNIGSLSDLELL